MKCAIRVDASLLIGCGHVVRCLTLADELKKSCVSVVFVCRRLPGDYISSIEKKGYPVCVLEKPIERFLPSIEDPPHADWLAIPWIQDAEETKHQLEKEHPDVNWLIVDHYALDHRWHSIFHKDKKKIMVIDDLADRKFDCDLLLDQTYGRTESDYVERVPKTCSLLMGARYALLRPQFAKKREEALARRSLTCNIRKILVCMGGVDLDNITSIALRGLEQLSLSDSVEIEVVLGGSAPWLSEVKEYALDSPLKVAVYSDLDDMADVILHADLAVGAGGTSSLERCCLGLPTYTVVAADNQQKVVEQLTVAGAIKSLPNSALISVEAIANGVENLISNLEMYKIAVSRAFSITDGLGYRRVVKTLLEKNFGIVMRQADAGDCEKIYQWQSIPGSRKYCRKPNVPGWSEHQEWFKHSLTSKQRELFIIEHLGEAVGLLRLDVIQGNVNTFEVSLLISGNRQRKGFAINTLRLLRHIRPDCTFLAEILEENIASKNLFHSAGFKKNTGTWYINQPHC